MEVEWVPYELRPYPTETLKPEEHYLQSTWKQSAYPMAEQMGVPIVLPNVSSLLPQSRRLSLATRR